MEKENLTGKKSVFFVAYGLTLFIVIAISIFISSYPRKVKQLFIKSSFESLTRNLDDLSEYTNRNVKNNFNEIGFMSDCLKPQLDGTNNYNGFVVEMLASLKKNMGYEQLGITVFSKNSDTMMCASGKYVKLRQWMVQKEFCNGNMSADIDSYEEGSEQKTKIVYRYVFCCPSGTEYMIVAQKDINAMDDLIAAGEIDDNAFTLVMDRQGIVGYKKGRINGNDVSVTSLKEALNKAEITGERADKIMDEIKMGKTGCFTMKISDDGTSYYVVYSGIENTDWICAKVCSEGDMTRNILREVNTKTLQMVFAVCAVLVMVLALFFQIVFGKIKEKGQLKIIEREKLFSEMSRYIPSAYVIFDSQKLNPDFISYNFHETTGMDDDVFLGNNLKNWLIPNYDGTIYDYMKSSGKIEKNIRNGERCLNFGIYDIGKIDGRNYFAMVFMDITREENSKKLLLDSIKRADAASNAKTDFLSKMSHEIRTPLNAVINYTNLSMEKWFSTNSDIIYDYMRKVNVSGTYLAGLVSDILDISRIEEGRMRSVVEEYSINKLVDEVKDTFMAQMKSRSIRFMVIKDVDDFTLEMDVVHIKQILNNLLSNALKFTGPGGTVEFETVTEKLDEDRVALKFRVKDNGIGMTKEFLEKVYEPFSQENRNDNQNSFRGSGLGMSICKNMVELLGGTIKVDSHLNKGTQFFVNLTVKRNMANHEFREEIMDASCLNGKKILVTDDMSMNREILIELLKPYGLEFAEAASGKECLEILENSGENEFMAVFMDIHMSGMNGYETAETIRKSGRKCIKNIPIVAMTADAFLDDVNKAIMSGMNYHVIKPVQRDKVISILIKIYKSLCG